MILAQPKVAMHPSWAMRFANEMIRDVGGRMLCDGRIEHSQGIVVDNESLAVSFWNCADRQNFGLWSGEMAAKIILIIMCGKELFHSFLLHTLNTSFVHITHCERHADQTWNSNCVFSGNLTCNERSKRKGRERKKKRRFISKWNLHTITTFYAKNNFVFLVVFIVCTSSQ